MANLVITAALDLKSTFRCIGVRAAFTGDDNANATLHVRYRKTGNSQWINAFTPIVDRRATINGTANPYVNEGRGSIVGLVPNTSYDIEATWADPDGVTGTNPRTGTISTLSLTPPLGGTEKWVDPAAGGGGDGSIGNPYNSIATVRSVARWFRHGRRRRVINSRGARTRPEARRKDLCRSTRL